MVVELAWLGLRKSRGATTQILELRVTGHPVSAGDVITPDDVFDALEDDLKVADMVLWVGISFEQSASTSYFRKVRLQML